MALFEEQERGRSDEPPAAGAQHGVTRRQLVAAAGAATAAAAVLGACGSDSSAEGGDGETSAFGEGDVGILNYALRLEHVAAAFYADAVGSGLFTGSDRLTMEEFGAEEAEHVDALTSAVVRLDGEPEAKPKTEFPLEDAEAALELAAMLENLGAAAYLGQLPHVEGRTTAALLLSIHSVEGRHAAVVQTLLGRPITPDGAFAEPAPVKAVLKSIEPFVAG